jgi:hypothetical protein
VQPQPLPSLPQQQQQQQQQQLIPVTVRFDSIKINNDHEGWASGSGEWILDAFVNGQNVHLSANKVLYYASSGKTYKFPPTAQAIVNVPRNGLVAVNVLGAEEDWCNVADDILTQANLARIGLPNLPQKVNSLLNSSGLRGFSTVTQGLDGFDRLLGTTAAAFLGGPLGAAATAVLGDPVKQYISNYVNKIACKANANEKTGEINELYAGPDFGTSPPGIQKQKLSHLLPTTMYLRILSTGERFNRCSYRKGKVKVISDERNKLTYFATLTPILLCIF